MKKILFLLTLVALSFSAQSQTITDTATLRANINANIIPNAVGSITAAKLNTILLGNITAFSKIGVTSITRHVGTDSCFYVKNGVETFAFLISTSASGIVSNSGSSNRLAYYSASGITVGPLAAITGDKALISSSSGLPTHSSTTAAELAWLSGTTSSVQTQLNNKWNSTGNAGTTPGTHFVGTTDAQDLVFKRNSVTGLTLKTGLAEFTGNISIPSATDGLTGVIYRGSTRFIHSFKLSGSDGDNLFIGNLSGNLDLTGSSGTQGSYNVGVGPATLYSNTTGFRNTAIGTYVLQNNTTGHSNTAVGFNSLTINTSGERNVTNGVRSLNLNTSGFANVAIGFDALFGNTTADHNTAVGLDALYYSNGSHNTAVGDSTLWGLYNTQKHMGYKNVAVGSRAGYHLGDTYPNYASIFDTAVSFIGANSSRDSSIPYTTPLKNSSAFGYNAKIFASDQLSFGDENITTNLFRGNIGIGTRTPGSALTIGSNVFTVNNLGVVGNGTWQGSAVGTAYGGTGINNSTNASGSFLRSNGANGNYVASTLILPNSGTANRLVAVTSTNNYGELAAITANRALISDANGLPVHSSVTATELGYVSGVSSGIQSQIDGRIAKTGASSTSGLIINDASTITLNGASGTIYSIPVTTSIDLSGSTYNAADAGLYYITVGNASNSFNLPDAATMTGKTIKVIVKVGEEAPITSAGGSVLNKVGVSLTTITAGTYAFTSTGADWWQF